MLTSSSRLAILGLSLLFCESTWDTKVSTSLRRLLTSFCRSDTFFSNFSWRVSKIRRTNWYCILYTPYLILFFIYRGRRYNLHRQKITFSGGAVTYLSEHWRQYNSRETIWLREGGRKINGLFSLFSFFRMKKLKMHLCKQLSGFSRKATTKELSSKKPVFNLCVFGDFGHWSVRSVSQSVT